MIVEVIMPKMGESLQEGTIIKWLKKPGDKVERDETLLEISTDKVDTEVPSPASGILLKILAEENMIVDVGKTIAEIETDAENVNLETQDAPPQKDKSKEENSAIDVQTKDDKSQQTASGNGTIVDVVMPKMGESLQEGTITKWLKKIGEKVERDEMILEISTDKVDTEVPSPASGILTEIIVPEGQTVEVGAIIARIATSEVALPAAVQAKRAAQQEVLKPEEYKEPAFEAKPQNIAKSDGKRFYSPVVRTIAKEHSLSEAELSQISGTGIDGRVTKKDIINYIDNRKSAPVEKSAEPKTKVTGPHPAPAKFVVPTTGDDVEIIPMDRVRQLIAEHMVYSKHTSAHVTSVTEADVTQIVKFREKYKNEFEKREGIKLTFTPFFARAVIEGILQNPMVNVSVDGTNIIRHKRIHLGMATALPDGNLIVPVIKYAEMLSFNGLQRAVTDLSNRARAKKLNPDDIQGGTFTITNYGTAGTLFGSPIINQPQTAILGLGAIQKRPVVRFIDGEYLIVIRDMIYLSLSYDHRVIDGQLAGTTLQAIVKSLENMNEVTIKL